MAYGASPTKQQSKWDNANDQPRGNFFQPLGRGESNLGRRPSLIPFAGFFFLQMFQLPCLEANGVCILVIPTRRASLRQSQYRQPASTRPVYTLLPKASGCKSASASTDQDTAFPH